MVQNPLKNVQKASYATVPDVIDMPIAKALSLVKQSGFHVTATAKSGLVLYQSPQANSVVSKSTLVSLTTGIQEATAKGTVVPNFAGMPMKEAINEGSRMGLQIAPTGDGFAISQSVRASSIVPFGSVVHVTFKPST